MTTADRLKAIASARRAIASYYERESDFGRTDLVDVICDLLLWADAVSDELTHHDGEQILRDVTANYQIERTA